MKLSRNENEMKNDFEIVFKENLILDEKSFRNNIEMRYYFTLKHYFRKWSLKSFRFISKKF